MYIKPYDLQESARGTYDLLRGYWGFIYGSLVKKNASYDEMLITGVACLLEEFGELASEIIIQ